MAPAKVKKLRLDKARFVEKQNWRKAAEICLDLSELMSATSQFEEAVEEMRDRANFCVNIDDVKGTKRFE